MNKNNTTQTSVFLVLKNIQSLFKFYLSAINIGLIYIYVHIRVNQFKKKLKKKLLDLFDIKILFID